MVLATWVCTHVASAPPVAPPWPAIEQRSPDPHPPAHTPHSVLTSAPPSSRPSHFGVDASLDLSSTLGAAKLFQATEDAVSASAILMFAFTCQVSRERLGGARWAGNAARNTRSIQC